ncbi:MAG: hypothetical protein GXO03_00390 [Aquificae bacterium]|nr:hypothetical protein [Aquificota bacterium]
MRLLAWSPVLPEGGRFPRREGRPFLPGSVLKEAFKDALVYYALKKDAALARSLARFLKTHRKTSLSALIKTVERSVLERYGGLLGGLKLPERVELPPEAVVERTVEVYDLRKKDFKEVFRSEVFLGAAELEGELPEELKSACHSYCEALLHAELTFLRDHPLGELFHRQLSSEIKRWEYPLRLGFWTTAPFGGRLFWFWSNKEVRNRVRRLYGIDIRPFRVIYLPREKQTAGWSEVKQDA